MNSIGGYLLYQAQLLATETVNQWLDAFCKELIPFSRVILQRVLCQEGTRGVVPIFVLGMGWIFSNGMVAWGQIMKEGCEQWDIKSCIRLMKVLGAGLWEPDLEGEHEHTVSP